MTEWLLPMMLPNDPQRKAARAMAIVNEVTYIAEAERVISGKVGGGELQGGVEWHLEDPQGDTIDEQYPDPRAREALALISDPTKLLDIPTPIRTRRHLWEITSRHMGACGYGWWVLDGLDGLGIPRAVMYVRPDRIVPKTDDKGTLLSWTLDPRPGTGGEGKTLELGEVVPFYLQPPNVGYLPTGLVESAILKAQLAGSIDKYFASIISGGGRLSGIISPKTGTIDDDGVFQQMLRDWRNVTEQPESGKRVQITRGPIEFTRTVSTIIEMALIDFLKANKADILEHWGVPLSQVGGYTPTGLNSGDTRKYDEAALWQNAVVPRLSEMHEGLQSILDRWQPLLGWVPRLVFTIPEFDDDSPRYDKLQKSQYVPLQNNERRGLIGYDPLPDNVIGSTGKPLGEEVWMPITLSAVISGGERVRPGLPAIVPSQTVQALGAVPSTSTGVKASPFGDSMRRLRAAVEERVTPHIRSAVTGFLATQKAEVVRKVRARAAHVAANPGDTTAWWDDHWDDSLTTVLRPVLEGVAATVREHVSSVIAAPGKAGFDPIEVVLTRGAARVTKINQTTRDGLAGVIAQGVEQGMGPAQLGDAVETWSGWDEYRAETIARTELMDAYNGAALGSYREAGVREVQAIDGDKDEECAARDGQTFSVEDADGIEDHPNGTLDWLPLFGEAVA